jgi:tRNA-Thr(GGU) m(6)t(6)A37 methyltransferase TsaA
VGFHNNTKKVFSGIMVEERRDQSSTPWQEQGQIRLTAIAIIRSCFTEKFGIPRQPGVVPAATARLEFLPPFDRQEMVRGLEDFSHIWVHFLFHETIAEGWKATVRPPRLGGKTRVGVFASRSPHRPNHLGLSVVKLENIVSKRNRVCLLLSGVDFLDGTPVLDIKPYIPYSDCPTGASGGYAQTSPPQIEVVFSAEAERFCASYRQATARNLRELIRQVIGHDPRPASQKGRKNSFAAVLWGVDVRWTIGADGEVVVEACQQLRVE